MPTESTILDSIMAPDGSCGVTVYGRTVGKAENSTVQLHVWDRETETIAVLTPPEAEALGKAMHEAALWLKDMIEAQPIVLKDIEGNDVVLRKEELLAAAQRAAA